MALLAAVRALHASGWKRMAALIARSIAAVNPRDLAVLRLLCTWALESGDHGAAEALCRRMLAAAPEEPGPLWDLAQLELMRGALPESVGHFQRHAELVAGPGYVTRALARRHLDLERAKSGQPYY